MFTRVGLTGGIAAGKTTVARRFAQLGAYVIDYDALSRQAVARGSAGLSAIVDAFGPEALNPDGTLNRPWMAAQVFSDPAKRATLNRIVHPLVFREAGRLEGMWLDANPEPRDGTRRLVVHDIPLLVETARRDYFDAILTVEAPPRVRMRRMVETRGMTPAEAADRIDAQSTYDQRVAISDYIIDSTKPMGEMMEDVDRLYRILTNPRY